LGEFFLRQALESDARKITDLIHSVGINPTGLDWRRFIVAVDSNGEVLGCGQIKPHGREIRELASIAVRPEWRGRGIARAVIDKLLESAQMPLYLMCMSDMGGLYEKFGFRPVARADLPKYFQRIYALFKTAGFFMQPHDDLLIMKLE
jgi:N-acetylglutamate synthase-like GNAT family acetyltransferase